MSQHVQASVQYSFLKLKDFEDFILLVQQTIMNQIILEAPELQDSDMEISLISPKCNSTPKVTMIQLAHFQIQKVHLLDSVETWSRTDPICRITMFQVQDLIYKVLKNLLVTLLDREQEYVLTQQKCLVLEHMIPIFIRTEAFLLTKVLIDSQLNPHLCLDLENIMPNLYKHNQSVDLVVLKESALLMMLLEQLKRVEFLAQVTIHQLHNLYNQINKRVDHQLQNIEFQYTLHKLSYLLLFIHTQKILKFLIEQMGIFSQTVVFD